MARFGLDLITTITMENPLLRIPTSRDEANTLLLEAVDFHTATPKTPCHAACWA